jgi:hypothetical protein
MSFYNIRLATKEAKKPAAAFAKGEELKAEETTLNRGDLS